MVSALTRVLLAAVLAGSAGALPHVGPHPDYATTYVTTIGGTVTTIEATIDPPWPTAAVGVAAVVHPNYATTYVTTIAGHVTTVEATIDPPWPTAAVPLATWY